MGKEKNNKNSSVSVQSLPDDSFKAVGISKTPEGRFSVDLVTYTASGESKRTPLCVEFLRGDAVLRAKAEFLEHVLDATATAGTRRIL